MMRLLKATGIYLLGFAAGFLCVCALIAAIDFVASWLGIGAALFFLLFLFVGMFVLPLIYDAIKD